MVSGFPASCWTTSDPPVIFLAQSPHHSPHLGTTTPHIGSYVVIEATKKRTHRPRHHVKEEHTTNSMREGRALPDEPAVYEIRINGHLDDRWADRFDGLTLSRQDNGDTLLTGAVVDQAALHGLLRAVRDLGVRLLSVTYLQSTATEAPDGRPHDTTDHSTKETQP